MKRLFFGGILPPHKKGMSDYSDKLTIINPDKVIISLHQHIGNPCSALVQVGDYVKTGQKIGDGDGMCVPVHASISGKVSAIIPFPNSKGDMVESIVIENDFKCESVAYTECRQSVDKIDTDMILGAIRESGIIGMGGAAFPGNIKAMSAMENVDTVIANACECEPYITSDDMLMQNDPEAVLEGMMIMHRLISPVRMVLAVEDNKILAIKKLKKLANNYSHIQISILPTRYPQGAEKQLIQALTGRQVPPGKIPPAVGCTVFNVSTFAAIYRAVCLGRPVTERIVTVSGEAVKNPKNFIVPIGTPISELIQAAGGLKEGEIRVIIGGPMMGIAQNNLSIPVVKATNSILCLFKDENFKVKNYVCIRCGKCVSVCPMLLKPLYLYSFILARRKNELNKLNLSDCIECGSCSYICPGKLPLTEKFRVEKKLLKGDDGK